ncbi:DUF2147 domain-containing protein [Lysobacter xanthus]
MRKMFIAALAAALPLVAGAADNSPVGRWKTLDDETGKVMTIAEVYTAQNGKLAAKIVEAVDASAATCTKCDGKDKNKSTVGMPILWNLKPVNGGWGDGEGFKPSAGMKFKAKSVKLVDGGKKLEVTGCKFVICKTATWVRAN